MTSHSNGPISRLRWGLTLEKIRRLQTDGLHHGNLEKENFVHYLGFAGFVQDIHKVVVQVSNYVVLAAAAAVDHDRMK